MFNFSANNLIWKSSIKREKYFIHQLIDNDIKRFYQIYDFKKEFIFHENLSYCVAGKVNSVDKLYLVVESIKIKKI